MTDIFDDVDGIARFYSSLIKKWYRLPCFYKIKSHKNDRWSILTENVGKQNLLVIWQDMNLRVLKESSGRTDTNRHHKSIVVTSPLTAKTRRTVFGALSQCLCQTRNFKIYVALSLRKMMKRYQTPLNCQHLFSWFLNLRYFWNKT